MKPIPLKLKDDLFEETEQLVRQRQISRNQYISQAIAEYNHRVKRELLAERFKAASLACREESLAVLHEFEALTDPLDEQGS